MSNILQWRSISEQSSFPFWEGSSVDLNRAIIDARINLPHQSGGAYLKSVSRVGDSVKIEVYSIEEVKIGTLNIDQSAESAVELVNDTGIHTGLIVFNKEEAMGLKPKTYSKEQTAFEKTCCVSSPFRRVSSLLAGKTKAVGHVALVEGAGIRIIKVNENLIRLDAIGVPAVKAACCAEVGDPVLGINDAIPDRYGAIRFGLQPFTEPDTSSDLIQLLRISTKTNGLNFYLSK
jgi:hypothetical protein